MGGKGKTKFGHARSGWPGVEKKRCPIDGCKKRAKHRLTDGSFLCRIHTAERTGVVRKKKVFAEEKG